jgi:hypothetical protein
MPYKDCHEHLRMIVPAEARVHFPQAPPSFSEPAVPRPSHRETPASSASRLLRRLPRPRSAAPRFAARRSGRSRLRAGGPPALRASSGRQRRRARGERWQRRGKMPFKLPIRPGFRHPPTLCAFPRCHTSVALADFVPLTVAGQRWLGTIFPAHSVRL